MENIFFPKMKKGTFFSLTSGGLGLEDYLPLGGGGFFGDASGSGGSPPAGVTLPRQTGLDILARCDIVV